MSSSSDSLKADIDLRLLNLWRQAFQDVQEWDTETVAAYLRAAYGKGYTDALSELVPGELCRTHHYRVPTRGAV